MANEGKKLHIERGRELSDTEVAILELLEIYSHGLKHEVIIKRLRSEGNHPTAVTIALKRLHEERRLQLSGELYAIAPAGVPAPVKAPPKPVCKPITPISKPAPPVRKPESPNSKPAMPAATRSATPTPAPAPAVAPPVHQPDAPTSTCTAPRDEAEQPVQSDDTQPRAPGGNRRRQSTREHILALLAKKPRTKQELASAIGCHPNNIDYHVTRLRDMNEIEATRGEGRTLRYGLASAPPLADGTLEKLLTEHAFAASSFFENETETSTERLLSAKQAIRDHVQRLIERSRTQLDEQRDEAEATEHG